MHVGSIAIANDLIGVVTKIGPDNIVLKDKHGVERSIQSKSCVEIMNPYAESLLMMKKLTEKVRGT